MVERRFSGQGLVEYALVILLVAIAIIGTLGLFSSTLSSAYTDFASVFP